MKPQEKNITQKSDFYISSPSDRYTELFLYPVQVGHFYYMPGYQLHRQSFDSFLLMYIVNGSCTVDFASRQITASKNSFVLLDCYQEHGYSTRDGWEALWIHFDGYTAHPLYEMITEKLGNVFTLRDSLNIVSRLEKMYELYHNRESVHEMLMHKYLNDILVDLATYSPKQTEALQKGSSMENIRLYIQKHIQEELRIEDLAREAMMSTYHFIRVFKKYTGMSPHEYIINYRLQLAQNLLGQTDMSISDICFETGFSSESVFCASFKKHLGISPTAYRKSQKHPEEDQPPIY